MSSTIKRLHALTVVSCTALEMRSDRFFPLCSVLACVDLSREFGFSFDRVSSRAGELVCKMVCKTGFGKRPLVGHAPCCPDSHVIALDSAPAAVVRRRTGRLLRRDRQRRTKSSPISITRRSRSGVRQPSYLPKMRQGGLRPTRQSCRSCYANLKRVN